MKVHLLNLEEVQPKATEHERACYERILGCAGLDARRRHELTENLTDADLILAASQGDAYGKHFRTLRRSALYKTYKRKTICYCPNDSIYPSVPGIYPSITPEWVMRGWACGGHYVSSHIHVHKFDYSAPQSRREFLFSFVGSSKTHRLRESLVHLKHDRSFIFDSTPKSSKTYWFQQDEQTRNQLFAQFEAILSNTKFALCPRGISNSSIRLFEAMEAGCVPVIVSDRLVLPDGPDWNSFCVQIPEKDVDLIPAALEAMEEQSVSMGPLARAAWEQYFSPSSTFDSLVGWGDALIRTLGTKNRTQLECQALVGEFIAPRNIVKTGREFACTFRSILKKGAAGLTLERTRKI